MTPNTLQIDKLIARVEATPHVGRRRIVGIAGGPASGKSTLADNLAKALCAKGAVAQVVPMDGFHLDNALLVPAGLLARKGAPETFDAAGFIHMIKRLRDELDVIIPHFDRSRDIAVAGCGRIGADCDTVIVEGNYLLYDAHPWRELADLWDLSIRIDPPLDVLRTRLVARWLAHGLSAEDALARAETNDLQNARNLAAHALPADMTMA